MHVNIIQVKLTGCLPVGKHLQKSHTFELHVNVVIMFKTSADDVKALGLVDTVKLRQPIEQLRSEPTSTREHQSNKDCGYLLNRSIVTISRKTAVS